ncbi:MAG: toll/interleukin-1 receptor domain-containing protein [Candidatus Rokuibacteriota bacterium]
MAFVHLAYRSHDRELALKLKEELEKKKHLVTIDVDFLVAGHYWRRRIDEAFAGADYLVVLLSKNAVDAQTGVINSHWIAADIGAARFSEKIVLPVLLDDIPFPELIDDIYSIRPRGNSLQEAASSLDDAIRVHQEIASLHLPRGYEHLTQSVRAFRQDRPYESSVFVMMKFSDGLPPEQARLVDRIFEVIASALGAYGLFARRADQKQYESDLWNNLCVYMLGCQFGLAVLEDHGANEMNPNVALEYGFMKAHNRSVGLLREEKFKHDRADLIGKLVKRFRIEEGLVLNEESLKRAIQDWMIDCGVPPKQRL